MVAGSGSFAQAPGRDGRPVGRPVKVQEEVLADVRAADLVHTAPLAAGGVFANDVPEGCAEVMPVDADADIMLSKLEPVQNLRASKGNCRPGFPPGKGGPGTQSNKISLE